MKYKVLAENVKRYITGLIYSLITCVKNILMLFYANMNLILPAFKYSISLLAFILVQCTICVSKGGLGDAVFNFNPF